MQAGTTACKYRIQEVVQTVIPIFNPLGGNFGIGVSSVPSDHKLQIHNASAAYARFALTNSVSGVASGDGLIFQLENLNMLLLRTKKMVI